MTKASLKYIDDLLTAAGIPYQFQEWTGDFVYPYYVGEYTESEPTAEDGLQESTFMITGTTDGSYAQLEDYKSKIKAACENAQTILPNGNGLAISYAGSINVPTGNAKMKRQQINLTIKEWEV